MRVIIAHTSGFCDGVKRAMRIALDAARRHGGVDSDGPLVHNCQALELLSLHGVAARTPADDSRYPLLIRAHGVPPLRRREWQERGRCLVDATCVHVARNQRLAAEAAGRGEVVVLAGDADHAEVQAVAASAGPECVVVGTSADFARIPKGRKVFFLAQTTFNAELFEEMTSLLRRDFPDCTVVDTICHATHDRQEEAAQLARRVEATVVVGGRNSANTRRLAEIAGGSGRPVFAVETASELREADFAAFSRVGVISGASTPGWVTQDVVNRLRLMGRWSPLIVALRVLVMLVQARISTALSAAGLALSAQLYLLGELRPSLAVAGAGYVFFAHTLNRRVPDHPEARRLSLVDSFYQKHRATLLTLAWAAVGMALFSAVREGKAMAALFVCSVIAAVIYGAIARRPTTMQVRTYPRNLVMAAGWSLILAGPPLMEAGGFAAGMGAMAFIFFVCIGGTLIRDLHDIASDSLMGMGTLPARIGLPAARRLAHAAFVLAVALPFLAAGGIWFDGGGVSPRVIFLLSSPFVPVLGIYLLDMVTSRRLNDAILLQAGVDGMGCLAGALALVLGVWA